MKIINMPVRGRNNSPHISALIYERVEERSRAKNVGLLAGIFEK